MIPPAPACPYCGSQQTRWEEAAATGSIYSFITVHRAFDPAFARDVPYVIVTVDLDAVQGDLVDAVDVAFQPAHVSVWLPPRLRPGDAGVNAPSAPIAARTQANSLGGTQGPGPSTTIRSAKKGV